ncbi:TPA: XRE family transcriptional regulator [Staphylococcus aureus]|nr:MULTISPECIES: XRE family transcriptional regulator [Staphylococcus]ATY56459.1 XRE family transcriptional regulator [Staphylococcus argenteus]ATZ86702.1 XRE family transcriptional regulator [Staphylococcus argenteus]AZH10368.1 XRE family transcriptional regulator [Staphylococcus aureus]MBX6695573.1 helix-turn-helix transcriptional regulator [Staphylococcus aureus]MBZ8160668.1 helix-turn-helix transcriptional regulator [Staphylococcus aureus]
MDKEKHLKHLMEMKSGSVKAFSEDIGLAYTTVRSILERGVFNAKVENIIKICKGLNIKPENIMDLNDTIISESITTLIKLTPPRQENVLNYANSQLDEQNSKGDNVVDINSYKQDKTPVNVNGCVSAGVGERLHDETLFTEMVKAPVPPHDLALKVNGDSMEPMFKDGEIIFVEKTHNIKNGQIGIFIIEEEAYVKKVFVEDDRLTLVSLNKEYRDLHFYRNESVRLVGKVIL